MIEKRLSQATDIEVRAIQAEGDDETVSTIIRGYAAKYNSPSVDLGGFIEQVAPGAFDPSLRDGRKIDAFWNHNPGQPLASTRSGGLKLVSDAIGLAFELNSVRMDPMMLAAVADGDAGVSFGFQTRKDTWVFPDDEGPAFRTLNEVELFEISLTVIPAYPATEASFRSMEAARAAQVAPDIAPKVLSDEFKALQQELIKRHHSNILARRV